MLNEYRVIKESHIVASNNDGYTFPVYDDCGDAMIITRYLVQVRGFLFWHTVKAFKKILPAARLLRHLRNLKDE